MSQLNKEYIIKSKSLGDHIKSLSGLFGLTRKEAQVLAAIIHIMNENKVDVVDKNVKKLMSVLTNYSYQVVVNYTNVFKRKRVLSKDGSLHPALIANKLIIEYNA